MKSASARAKSRPLHSMIRVLVGLSLGLGIAGNAAPPQAPPSAAKPGLAIVSARIYPSPGARPIEDGVVLIRSGRIVRVGPRSATSVPRGMRVIDAHGAVLTAGFWNSHIHLMTPELFNAAGTNARTVQAGLEAILTRWGFTSVFDLASPTDNASTLRRRIQAGEIETVKIGRSTFVPYRCLRRLIEGWTGNAVSTAG